MQMGEKPILCETKIDIFFWLWYAEYVGAAEKAAFVYVSRQEGNYEGLDTFGKYRRG